MRNTCLWSQVSVKVVLFLGMAAAAATPLCAQNDLQVMVSGPWSYVTDQVNYPGQLLLVAPESTTGHALYIEPGTSSITSTPPASALQAPGIYTIQLNSLPGYLPSVPANTPILCGGAITNSGTITNVDQGTDNYVISLPMPDMFTTYLTPSGLSTSEVSSSPITGTSPPTSISFTTLMVLHYGVNGIASGLTVNGIPNAISTNGAGIGIVYADPDMSANTKCDSLSLYSTEERNALWMLNQYARFPVLVDGNQTSTYDYIHCSDSNSALRRSSSVRRRGDGRKRVTQFKSPKPQATSGPAPESVVGITSAGSADCHACQMSINSAVPGAIVPVTTSQ
jgi:hypothetical protein